MNQKPLLPRFAMLALIIAVAILALNTKPIKKGMDLEGGHSLIFRVSTDGDNSKLIQTIDVLKERVDPTGSMNLEWRPVGDDRFEVRMPIGSKQSRELQLEFLGALEALTADNIGPAFIRTLTNAPTEKRSAMIAEKCGDNAKRAELLEKAVAKFDQAEAEYAKVADQAAELKAEIAKLRADAADLSKIDDVQDKLDALTAQHDVLRSEYYELVDNVYSLNIRTSDIRGILSYYVPPRLASEYKRETYDKRKQTLEDGLKDYKASHEKIAAEIDNVTKLYKSWASQRGQLDDPEDLIRLIRRAGVLEFRITAPVTEGANYAKYFDQLADPAKGPKYSRDRNMDYQWFPVKQGEQLHPAVVQGESGGKIYALLSNMPGECMLQGKDSSEWKLTGAMPSYDRSGGRSIAFQLDNNGGDIFSALTGSHIGQPLAILLDDEVYSAPNINSTISDRGEITGSFTASEQRELIRILNSGSIRARVNPDPVAVNSIGPTLGQENIRRGQQAAIYGMICVLIFMVIYYLAAGVIADIALSINILLILAAMSAFDVVFTLPGIAGLILTIGIAVDANVLIFERLREEKQTSSDLPTALSNAYSRAFSAIIDGNLTTLLVCAILWWVGTQEIKGFAMTLGIGIVISLFTALLVTRWIFRLIKPAGWNTTMGKIVGQPSINWFGKRKAFWALSIIVIVAGLFSIFSRGSEMLGIEFSKGSRAVICFNDEALVSGGVINDAKVEQMLTDAGSELQSENMSGQNVQVNVLKTLSKAEDFIARYDSAENGGNDDAMVSVDEWTAQDNTEASFSTFLAEFDSNSDKKLDAAELESIPEPRYQITSSEDQHQEVRKVIDKAFEGMLNSITSVKFELITDSVLGVDFGGNDYSIIPVSLSDGDGIGGDYRQVFEANAGAVITAFKLPETKEAMTKSELLRRLSTTRLQAGREQTYVVNNIVLPLTPVAGSSNRFSSFAVISQSTDVPPRETDSQVWDNFAAGEAQLLADALGSQRSLESLTNFDAAMSSQATQLAVVAVMLSWIGIIVYLWVRFGSVQWGIAAVICLIHDTLVVVGLVGICGMLADTGIGKALMLDAFKIDMAVIAAILTVIGYSVNDTIVVFDRIRENRKKTQDITPSILNRSINQTLARTLLTSFTTLLVVVVMYIWGGDGIHGFSFTLLVGVLFGTYSSIAIASPLVLGFKDAIVASENEQLQAEAEQQAKADGMV